jgi:hypothetical protein
MSLEAVQEMHREIHLACARLSAAIGATSGDGWRLAIELAGDEQEPRVVGVEDSSGTMVMGDCMSDVNNEVAVGDARFIAMLEGAVANGLRDILKLSRDLKEDSPIFLTAYLTACALNTKWDQAERALSAEGRT